MATAYVADQWHDFFFALMGAAAALAGLIFVAVSLNNAAIVKHPRLPAVAARAIATLIALVLMSLLVLTPGQSIRVLGAETLVLGLGLTVPSVVSSAKGFDDDMKSVWRWQLMIATVASTAPMAVAGVSLTLERGGGLYWALAESVIGIGASVYYAWILLIEILR